MEFLGFVMAAQFAPDRLMGTDRRPDGWLYRKDQTGPALPVTEAERNRYVRWFGWIMLSSVLVMFGLMIGMAFVMAHLIPNETNLQGALGAIPMVVVAFGGTYLYLKYFSHAPARDFADRAPVAPARPLAAVYGGRMAKVSYRKIALATLGMMVVFPFSALSGEIPASDLPWAIPFMMGIPLVIGLGSAWWKWRIERSGA